MLYEILAVLWSGPAEQADIALGIAGRTKNLPALEVVDGHLWFLTRFGFTEELSGGRDLLYRITPSGSALLALAAEEQQPKGVVI